MDNPNLAKKSNPLASRRTRWSDPYGPLLGTATFMGFRYIAMRTQLLHPGSRVRRIKFEVDQFQDYGSSWRSRHPFDS